MAAKPPMVATTARFATLCSGSSRPTCWGSSTAGTAPQMTKMPRLAGTIDQNRRRSPLGVGGGSSLPAVTATNVFSVIGAVSAAGDGVVTVGSSMVRARQRAALKRYLVQLSDVNRRSSLNLARRSALQDRQEGLV